MEVRLYICRAWIQDCMDSESMQHGFGIPNPCASIRDLKSMHHVQCMDSGSGPN